MNETFGVNPRSTKTWSCPTLFGRTLCAERRGVSEASDVSGGLTGKFEMEELLEIMSEVLLD